jgi:hypothetical protein
MVGITAVLPPLAAERDGALVDELALASEQPRTRRLDGGGGSAVVEVARHPEHSVRDAGEVDRPLHSRRREAAGARGPAQRLGRAKQRLRRHASPVRALAAHELSLDDREREAATLEARRERFCRDAAAEANDVKLLRHAA